MRWSRKGSEPVDKDNVVPSGAPAYINRRRGSRVHSIRDVIAGIQYRDHGAVS